MAELAERLSIVFSYDELVQLTKYRRPSDQLRELHERGFSRAYIRAGEVVLERAHFDAVARCVVEKARGRVKPPVVSPRRQGGR